jgi:hypothetical protein
MMTLTTAQVKDAIVAIKVCETVAGGGITRGEGVSFWCNVGGVQKLVTAAHLAWPRPMTKPINEVLYVHWATTTLTGGGEAIVMPHTPAEYPDFAEISFLDPSNNPPRGLVFPVGPMPTIGDQVVCVGCPGAFIVPPAVTCTNGTITNVTAATLSIEALVNGLGAHGYSGGPVFPLQRNDEFDDHVVGLMSGAPPLQGALPNANGVIPHDPNKWVFFGAVSFK